MRRRDFIQLPCALAAGALFGRRARAAPVPVDERYEREAAWWEPGEDGLVTCKLCPVLCKIESDRPGSCQVRMNRGGKLVTRVYGRPVTIHDDPVEKKPLFHFLPATRSLSLSCGGCNMACQFCQNWELSQSPPEKLPDRHGFVSPQQLVSMAQRLGSASIALTYAEPIVAFEYDLAIAKASRQAGIPAVMVSNGYIELGPLDQLLPELGAYKVDFKAFDDKFYRQACHARLDPVLKAMKRIHERGVWLELVHLTIPTLNDDSDQFKRLCGWILEQLGPDVPIHFTRFHPTYMLRNLPVTPPTTLERAWVIAKQAGLHYAYLGNLAGHECENTRCHACGKLLIRRVAYQTELVGLRAGACSGCGQKIPGVWRWPT